ncbi:MAG TPA: Gfo/Idh/MocA family oxidoreductase [Rhodothermales bacterium]|nr:Gfo/Idh/MocA family oxidoreductase [Rhodothermales bacterium]
MRLTLLALSLLLAIPAGAQTASPVRIAIVGMSHGHVGWILGRPDRGDIQVVGIYETDQQLIDRLAGHYHFDKSLVYDDLGAMLDAVKPDAVVGFGSVFDHLKVVEAAAPRKIDVMVEKPLAANLEQAERMAALTRQNGIHLIVNYETTWYATTEAVQQIVHDGELGPVRKIVVHDGHQGPIEIGVSSEFLAWLTDPVLNGGGALMDFGCYGADLVTAIMDGQAPLTVTAVTQQIKPDEYPKVDDEATFILTYPKAQAILQASWNWPFNRKDLEVYGTTGYVKTVDGQNMRVRKEGEAQPTALTLDPRPVPFDDPFAYFAAVVRGDVVVQDGDLASLPTNVTVMRILDAATRSAKEGRTITLSAP